MAKKCKEPDYYDKPKAKMKPKKAKAKKKGKKSY